MKYKFEDIAINSTAKKLPEPSDNEHYIGLEHLDSGNLYVTRWGADTAPIGEKLLMKKGDVLFGKRRAYQKKVGIAPFDGIFSAHGMVLRPKEDVICKEFFPFFISSDYFLNEAIRISVGGLSPTINWKDLRVLEFELPSLEEQRVLADKLWAAYEVKESYKNLLAQTDKLLHAQFEKMFGEEESNGVVGNIATVVSGQSIPAILEDEKGDYPYVKVADFNIEGNERRISTSSHLITSENAEQSRIIPIGTIVFAKNGAASLSNKKRVTNVECCIDMNVIGVIPSEKVIPDFLLAFFESINISDYVRQGAIPSIAPKDVENIGLFIPSMEKQLEFVRIAEQAERTKASLNKGIEAIEAVIRSLIAEGTTKV